MSENSPTLSVITVTLNDLTRLRKTAISLLKQSSLGFEWLIVDGESSDGTKKFLKEIASDSRVNFFELDPAGIYNAMNFGVKVSKGTFVQFLNAGDTYLSSTSLINVENTLKTLPTEYGALATTVPHLTKKFEIYDLSIPTTQNIGDYTIAHFNHQGVYMLRRVFQEIGGFDENLKFAADGKLLDRAVDLSKVLLTRDMYVGFEVGGTAVRNYFSTVKEMEEYRPSTQSPLNFMISILKNYAKVTLIDISNLPIFSELLTWYIKLIRSRNFKYVVDLSSKNFDPNSWE